LNDLVGQPPRDEADHQYDEETFTRHDTLSRVSNESRIAGSISDPRQIPHWIVVAILHRIGAHERTRLLPIAEATDDRFPFAGALDRPRTLDSPIRHQRPTLPFRRCASAPSDPRDCSIAPGAWHQVR
jgi:hypothetical protein